MKKIIFVFFIFMAVTVSFAEDYPLKLHFIDIGEGDAILIQAKNKSALIDTGNILSGYKLTDYLNKHNITAVNHLLITHADSDHICGLFFLMPKFKVENTYDNGRNLPDADNSLLSYYKKIIREKGNYRALREGDRLKLDDAVLEVIWPPKGPLDASFNYDSIVVMLTYKKFRCLLAADIDNFAQNELLRKRTDLKSDILKIAHHGAKDATLEEFLKRVRPKIAVISVDANNPRGYPEGAVLDRLKANNIKTYRTDKNGTIIITVDKNSKFTIATEN